MLRHIKQLTDNISVGPQPRGLDFQEIFREGYRTVINLRTDDEPDMQLEPDAERGLVKEAGMHYIHLPVSMETADAELVETFRQKIAKAHTRIYVHCASGKRAGAFAMMHLGVKNGWSGEDTLKRAEDMGFECENEDMIQFVKSYIDTHQPA